MMNYKLVPEDDAEMIFTLGKTKTELRALQCGTCGVWHAIPEAMHESCLSEGGYWTCPNGHSRGYSEGSLQSRLEKEIKRREWAEANANRQMERADSIERKRIAQKAATTRLANRIKARVCPCCHRTFKQLERHMANKHPDYNPESVALGKLD